MASLSTVSKPGETPSLGALTFERMPTNVSSDWIDFIISLISSPCHPSTTSTDVDNSMHSSGCGDAGARHNTIKDRLKIEDESMDQAGKFFTQLTCHIRRYKRQESPIQRSKFDIDGMYTARAVDVRK